MLEVVETVNYDTLCRHKSKKNNLSQQITYAVTFYSSKIGLLCYCVIHPWMLSPCPHETIYVKNPTPLISRGSLVFCT